MADSGKIKQKIELEGEKEYSAALKEANRNLKTLRSALKAETAELGSNATAQQKNETKIKSLKKQIAEQEKVVKTYRAALAEVREKYADNEEEIAKWETRLNVARTSLANMKNELETASASVGAMSDRLEDAGDASAAGVVASKSFADALKDIGTTGNSIAEGIEGIFTGFASALKDAASAVWEEIVSLSAKANRWSDLAGFWNTSTEKVRQFEHAINASGNEFDTFSQMITKMSLLDPEKVWEFAGVSAEGDVDQLEYVNQIMNSLAGMDYNQRKTAIEGMFGSSWKNFEKIVDLAGDWTVVQEKLKTFDPEGAFGITDEGISQMNQLSIDLATIDAAWDALKEKMALGIFGEVSLKLTGDAQGIVDAFAAFMDADTEEEKLQAMEDFQKSLEDFFRDLGEAISAAAEALGEVGKGLEGSEDNMVALLGKVISGFSDALEWIADEKNWGAVKTGFDALIGVWAGAKVAGAVGNLASFAANIGTLSRFKNWNELSRLFNGTGDGAPVTGGTGNATGGGGGWFSNLFGMAGVGAIVAGFDAAANERKTNTLIRGSGANVENAAEQTEGLEEAFTEYVEANKAIQDLFTSTEYTDEKAWELYEQMQAAQKVFESLDGWQELMDAYNAWRQENGYGNDDWFLPQKAAEPEIVEDIDLTEKYSRADAEFAIQDWWDAWRNAENGDDTQEEADAAQEWMEEVFGEDFGAIWERLVEKMDENGTGLEDVPADWYSDILDALTWENAGDDEGPDLTGFMALPGRMRQAVADAVSGIRVTIDGMLAGRILAPYVSEYIAEDMV